MQRRDNAYRGAQKTRKRITQAVPLQFESLEARLALAGVVTVTTAKDNLTVTGDDLANDISVSVVGLNWRISGNNGTTVRLTKTGAAGPFVDVPIPQSPTPNFKDAKFTLGFADVDANHKNGNESADVLSLSDLTLRGNLTISGKNGGVVEIAGTTVNGTSKITFANGLSAPGLGSAVEISDSNLGAAAKSVTITTGIQADNVVITDTRFGKDLTINTKDGNNTVALLGTRSDVGGVFNSSTKIGGNVTVTTGSGNDGVGFLGVVVDKKLKIGTGKGDDFSGAADMAVAGTTSVTSTDGNDIAAIGLQDADGNTLPQGGLGNALNGNVTVSMGNGNDLVAAHETFFGKAGVGNLGKFNVNLGSGDDRLAESENFYELGAFDALKGVRGGTHISGDAIISDLSPLNSFEMKVLQFESQPFNSAAFIQDLLDDIFAEVDDHFGDILLAYGIDISGGGGGGGGGSDPDDQLSEAIALGAPQGNAVAGNINVATDVDIYSIDVTAGQIVDFSLHPTSANFDAVLQLYDANGVNLESVDGGAPGSDEVTQIVFNTTGTFFVGVSGAPNYFYDVFDGTGDAAGSTGSYELTVSSAGTVPDPDDEISEATDLGPVGAQVDAFDSIETARDVDMFAFSVAAGQTVSISVAPGNLNLDIYVRLFDDQGNELGFADAGLGGAAETLQTFFNEAGTFFVGVSSFPNTSYDPLDGTLDVDGDELGDYTLSIVEII